MTSPKFLAALTLALLLPLTANAGEYYVDPAIIKPQFLPTPPPENSAPWNIQLQQIIKMQSLATKEEFKIAEAESKLDINAITPALGQDVTEKSKPKTYKLLKKLEHNCKAVIHQAKDYWKTTRPYHFKDKGVKTLVTPPKTSGAYPSGHTACTRLWAESLTQIIPAKADELRKKASESAYYRIIGGMHWFHDVKGGEISALMLFGALQLSDEYQKDLASAAAEWK